MTARQEERGIADPPQSAGCLTFPLEQEAAELWGAMRGRVTVAPGNDLTQGTDETWEAEA
jgi:hypothetical protein